VHVHSIHLKLFGLVQELELGLSWSHTPTKRRKELSNTVKVGILEMAKAPVYGLGGTRFESRGR
jgi:hypothetical protein